MMTLEKEIEVRLLKKVADLDGMAVKFRDPAHRGAPDRLVMIDSNWRFFVELKRPKGKLAKLQIEYAKKLRRVHQMVFLLESESEVDRFFLRLQYLKSVYSLVDNFGLLAKLENEV